MTRRRIYKLIFCLIKTRHSTRSAPAGADDLTRRCRVWHGCNLLVECGAATICSLHPRIDPIAMPPKAKTPWQPAHGLEYVLEVVSTVGNGDITVRCMFCIYEGRDSIVVDGNSTQKRKSCNDIKYFLKPFLPHKYISHHDGQHAKSWALYKAVAKKDKQHFFDNKIKVANTLHRYMDLDNDILTFMINANIVNTIIDIHDQCEHCEYDHWRHVLSGQQGGR
ncbi:hypothetical protein BDL97_13G098700 [Sphagnum fallax]|nr:hypothetical protein BDL97_13G098700 [Sphagnum fallax]